MSCAQAGCHTKAPTGCTTCHGSQGTARPATGAHWAHTRFCDTCHQVPLETTADIQRHASQTREQLLHFSGRAIGADSGALPTWDPESTTCANVYCHHGSPTPAWTTTEKITCNGCHKAPPDSHERWKRLATTPESCAACHPAPTESTHVNGEINITVTDCTACHGSNGHPNPPVSLTGSTDPTTRGVGAHERHLDGTLADKIGKPLICNDCHPVPTAVVQAGHFDQATTTVRFPFGGAYDANSATCTVWCHFNRTPGPTWTNSSGSSRTCDSCHEFPPRVTRAGTPHPTVIPDLNACKRCHVFSPATHVNGVTDYVTE